MLSYKKFLEVQKLLANGEGLRETARTTGVSRSIVQRIQRGEHAYCKEPPQVEKQEGLPRPIHPDSLKTDCRFAQIAIQYIRCPGCGGMVQAQVPCMKCSLEQELKSFDEFLDDLLQPAVLPYNPWSLDQSPAVSLPEKEVPHAENNHQVPVHRETQPEGDNKAVTGGSRHTPGSTAKGKVNRAHQRYRKH